MLAAATVVASLLLGLLVRGMVLSRLQRLARATASPIDDVLLESLRRPLPYWFLLAGTYVALHLIRVGGDLTRVVDKILVAGLILSITFWFTDLASRLLQVGFTGRGPVPARTTGVVRYAMRIGIFAIGVLVLLSTLGISVTPVLTTLGIGGLAIALGLQETLANLFAGMQLTLARNLRVGDFIRLETGQEGHIEDISWRATRIRTLPNNNVLIPNSRLAQSVVTNYSLPAKDLTVLVEVGVHYASDLDLVERLTIEVARTVMQTVAGGVPEFEPLFRFHTFGESSIDFTVTLRAREFADTFLVKHAFIKALARAFATEQIVIPFPIRAINLEQERVPQTGTAT